MPIQTGLTNQRNFILPSILQNESLGNRAFVEVYLKIDLFYAPCIFIKQELVSHQ